MRQIAPGFSTFLFPEASLPFLQLLSQIGVLLFMFIVGAELRVHPRLRHRREPRALDHDHRPPVAVLDALGGGQAQAVGGDNQGVAGLLEQGCDVLLVSDASGVERVAASLTEPFVYAGTYSAHRRRRHGARPVTGRRHAYGRLALGPFDLDERPTPPTAPTTETP